MPGHERFAGMLSIPYLSAGGVTAIKFRRLDDGKPKYNGPSQKARLFNSRVCAQGGDLVVVCEGELDTIVAGSVLGVPAVGTPGGPWLPHWPRMLADFDRVVVIADHDQKLRTDKDGKEVVDSPGLKHADKVVRSLSGAEKVVPPAGCDLTDWFLAEGADPIKKAVGLL